jgi:molybdopterin biosynthesis enzyme
MPWRRRPKRDANAAARTEEKIMANELFTVVPPQDALDILLTHCAPIARTVTVPLADAFGRVTASVIHAAETLPAFARSTMDGYAVVAADTFGSLRVGARVPAPVRRDRNGCRSPSTGRIARRGAHPYRRDAPGRG